MIHSVPVLCFTELALNLATLIIALALFFNVFTPNLTLAYFGRRNVATIALVRP